MTDKDKIKENFINEFKWIEFEIEDLDRDSKELFNEITEEILTWHEKEMKNQMQEGAFVAQSILDQEGVEPCFKEAALWWLTYFKDNKLFKELESRLEDKGGRE